MKIGFLGPKGTFSYEAAKRYGEGEQLIEYNTISKCIKALEENQIDKAIVPIENSLQGGVTETIDILIETEGIYVNDEIVLNIRHNLIAKENYQKEDIKEIYSHVQAIEQCRKYIEKNLPNAHTNYVSSTALAAEIIQDKENCACIANQSCINEYNLCLLEENIQDNDFNQTKFWVLSKTKNNTGKKMSIIFSCNHKPGALYQILRNIQL